MTREETIRELNHYMGGAWRNVAFDAYECADGRLAVVRSGYCRQTVPTWTSAFPTIRELAAHVRADAEKVVDTIPDPETVGPVPVPKPEPVCVDRGGYKPVDVWTDGMYVNVKCGEAMLWLTPGEWEQVCAAGDTMAEWIRSHGGAE